MYGSSRDVGSIKNVFGQEVKVGDPILYFGACTADARVGRLKAVKEYFYVRDGKEEVYGRYPIVESAGIRCRFIYDYQTKKGHYERGNMVRWTRQLSGANVFPLSSDMVHDTGEPESGYFIRQNTSHVAKFLKLFD